MVIIEGMQANLVLKPISTKMGAWWHQLVAFKVPLMKSLLVIVLNGTTKFSLFVF